MSVQFLNARAVRLHPGDDVAVALVDLAPGSAVTVDGARVVTRASIPAGHKLAVEAVEVGRPVRRYSQVIGVATLPISAGDHVHTHNLAMAEIAVEHDLCSAYRPTVDAGSPATFQAIVRSDGRIATRNYLAVLSTVNCSATVARMIADRVQATSDVSGRSSFDGVVALTHGTGCGMGSTGEGIDLLRRTLAGFANHPNFGGVLLVGLGCEANQAADIVDTHGLVDSDRFRTLNIQDVGGTSACVEAGSKIVESMMASATDVQRQPVSVSHLKLGLQCGGSDGYSGITANPALGAAADILVRHGGTAILSETPEIYGAEHLLTSRAATPDIARALLDRIAWWEDYTARNHGTMDNNPSPGNKAGGLTTILEKSLGAVAKSGTSGLMGVYGYGEQIDTPGFVFMDSPGYDPVSVTGQVASGANVVCFTTGRGSAYGCVPAPSLKLSTTTALFERQRDDIDINCGAVLDSGVSVEEMGERIFAEILRVASGARTKSEALGYGHNEFAPWVVGAVM